jgi:transketolase
VLGAVPAQQDAPIADILPRCAEGLDRGGARPSAGNDHRRIDGLRFGIDSFGASAPIEALYDHFGLTAEKIAPQIVAAFGN